MGWQLSFSIVSSNDRPGFLEPLLMEEAGFLIKPLREEGHQCCSWLSDPWWDFAPHARIFSCLLLIHCNNWNSFFKAIWKAFLLLVFGLTDIHLVADLLNVCVRVLLQQLVKSPLAQPISIPMAMFLAKAAMLSTWPSYQTSSQKYWEEQKLRRRSSISTIASIPTTTSSSSSSIFEYNCGRSITQTNSRESTFLWWHQHQHS